MKPTMTILELKQRAESVVSEYGSNREHCNKKLNDLLLGYIGSGLIMDIFREYNNGTLD